MSFLLKKIVGRLLQLLPWTDRYGWDLLLSARHHYFHGISLQFALFSFRISLLIISILFFFFFYNFYFRRETLRFWMNGMKRKKRQKTLRFSSGMNSPSKQQRERDRKKKKKKESLKWRTSDLLFPIHLRTDSPFYNYNFVLSYLNFIVYNLRWLHIYT